MGRGRCATFAFPGWHRRGDLRAQTQGDVVTLDALKAANIVRKDMTSARIILSGDVTRALTIKGLKVTKGARAAIEAAGGNVEE